MSPPMKNPLNDQHCDCLNGCLSSCAQTQQLIDAAKRAGIDMSQAEATNEAHREMAKRLKQDFFPNKA